MKIIFLYGFYDDFNMVFMMFLIAFPKPFSIGFLDAFLGVS